MADRERFDFVVIGAGPAGSEAALRLGGKGGKTALVEKEHPGGTCLNWGCIPTKVLASAARKLAWARRAGETGIRLGEPSVDARKLFAKVGETVSSLREDLRLSLQRSKVEFIAGEAKVGDDGLITVAGPAGGARLIEGAKVLLATGAKAAGLPGLPLDGETVIDSRTLLERAEIPGRMAVIGGGAIGCELAWIFSTLGSSVTIIEIASRLLPGMDKDIAGSLAASFTKSGIGVRLGASAEGVEKRDGETRVLLAGGEAIPADRVLVAVGRTPGLGYLDPPALGIKVEQGRIAVDDRLQTTHPGWYAAGDLIPGPMLAYTADDEGRTAADNMAGERPTSPRLRRASKAVPLAVFCWPECAQVGEVEGSGLVSARSFFKGNARARCEGEVEGLVKVFAEKETGVIRGFSMMGPYVSELIGEATVLVEEKVTLARLSEILHVHPALSEALSAAAVKMRERS